MQNEIPRGDFYSMVVRRVIAPLWARRERSPYLRYLERLEKAQYRHRDEVKEDQWRRFKRLLTHAYHNTNFYRERLKACGVTPEDIRSWEDLTWVPVLTKNDIRTHKENMVARNIPGNRLFPKKTSGSTGVSLEFCVDDASLQWKRACAIRHDRWTGWNIGERIGAIWGNPVYRKSLRGYIRNTLLERFLYLDTLKMNEKEMLGFYRRIKKKRPTLLFGHAHSLYLFARFLAASRLMDIRVKGIISTAMVLHDFERKEIERVFDCKVTNRYGCEEVSLIACECREHHGFHINADSLVVEFSREGIPVQPGESGAILVTDLTNSGMPFIRYKVGDVGIPSSDRLCGCGCTYPLMDSLEGRIADYVVTPDGDYVSGISLTENFAMLLGGIKQLQIVQERIDYLVLRVVRGEGFSEGTLKEIGRLIALRFGGKMKHSVEFVDSIQQEQSGKYRFCISKLEGQLF